MTRSWTTAWAVSSAVKMKLKAARCLDPLEAHSIEQVADLLEQSLHLRPEQPEEADHDHCRPKQCLDEVEGHLWRAHRPAPLESTMPRC
jgi:hypothetical protein